MRFVHWAPSSSLNSSKQQDSSSSNDDSIARISTKCGASCTRSDTQATFAVGPRRGQRPEKDEQSEALRKQVGATDRIAYPCIHGASATHIDSLAHTFFAGKMWNGYDTSALVTMQKGAEKNSVLPMKNGIVTRAVLHDIARLKGVPHLAPGDRIFPEDMEAWEKKTGVRAGPGDALVLRWGRYGRRAKLGPDDNAAGFDNSILPWLKQRDVALIVWETAGYSPQPPGDLFRNAVHNFVQAILGIHILDRAHLEALSEAAASRNRWEFMLMVTPLALPNATGTPVNPIAMF